MPLFSTIICCINLTENSDDIVQYTRNIAKTDNARVIVVHSLPSIGHMLNHDFVISRSTIEDLLKESRARVENFLKDFVEKNFAGLKAEALLMPGNPAHELIELADKVCADLIIMGSMSTKGLFSFMFSRPSESVIGHSRVPVMVIPNDLNLECTPPDNF